MPSPKLYPKDLAIGQYILGMEQTLEGVLNRYKRGDIDIDGWKSAMTYWLRTGAGSAREIGLHKHVTNPTEYPQLTPKEKAEIQRWVADQAKYIDGFAETMRTSSEFNPAWYARARMYSRSLYSQYWEGKTSGWALPAQPGQGTQCLSNCKCRWEIKVLDAARGNAEAYWRLGAAEHCQTCEVRSEMWNPVLIQGGDLTPGPEPASGQPAPTAPRRPTAPKVPKPPKAPAGGTVDLADRAQYHGGAGLPPETWGSRVSAAIAKVHGIPASMPRLRYYLRTMKDGMQGQYWTGKSEINLRAKGGQHPHLTTVHETGHWLDNLDFGATKTDGYCTLRFINKPFREWRDAMHNSNSYKRLKGVVDTAKTYDGGHVTLGNLNWCKYATGDEELWARAYSQYIAVKSGDPVLLAELRKERVGLSRQTMPSFWEDADFQPISDAFDKLFASHGLLK